MAKKSPNYDLKAQSARPIAPPILPYEPLVAKKAPPIGLIGCGGISQTHLKAYKLSGYNVVALCDLVRDRAVTRQKEFYPEATIYTDYRELLKRDDIQVVDIATHPGDREYLVPAALNARKHVLSQKPFVMDLDLGEKFADLADKNNVTLAVNQNGRWAPYFSFMRQAVKKGLIGQTIGVHLGCHWDHQWIVGTPFDSVYHIVLYDFAIHYFDAVYCLMNGAKATKVHASLAYAPAQRAKSPMLGQALIEFEHGQASLVFDASTKVGSQETSYIFGTKGTMQAHGNLCAINQVKLITADGTSDTHLKGNWFPDGFRGSMGELLTSLQKHREPVNSARDNLKGLALCFAAVASADSGKPVKVGAARKLPKKLCTATSFKK